MKRILFCTLLAISFSCSATTFDFTWTYPNPQPEDVGKLDGLQAITTCNLDGVDVPIPDALISDYSVLNTPMVGSPGQTLTC